MLTFLNSFPFCSSFIDFFFPVLACLHGFPLSPTTLPNQGIGVSHAFLTSIHILVSSLLKSSHIGYSPTDPFPGFLYSKYDSLSSKSLPMALTFTISFLYYFFVSTENIIYSSLVFCLTSAFFNLNIRSLRE